MKLTKPVLLGLAVAISIALIIQMSHTALEQREHGDVTSEPRIDHTFVINLKGRPDRWNDTNQAFAGTGLKLQRWDAVNGKALPEEYVRKITSTYCNLFCSNSMIGIWLSHYSLWKHIADHKLDNVLILEDDAQPVPDFDAKLKAYWKNVPKDWDILFLGCFECEEGASGKISSVNGNEHLFVPKSPAGMHGYMVSHKGARKLVDELKEVSYHIDIFLANRVFDRSAIKMYAFKPYLIYQDTASESDNQGHAHRLLTKVIRSIEPTDVQLPMSTSMNSQLWNIRYLDIPVTALSHIIFGVALAIGLLPYPFARNTLLATLIMYEFSELALSNPNKTRTKTILFEIAVIAFIAVATRHLRKAIGW